MEKLHLAPSTGCTAASNFSNNLTKAGEVTWRLGTTIALAFVLFAFCGRLAGQAVNATLLGTVSDSSGAVVIRRASRDYRDEHWLSA